MIPRSNLVDSVATATEPAMLELGCVIQGIKHVIVCGHSDCKAMNNLYALHKAAHWSSDELAQSPIKAWLSQ